jgi:hypothetical protein
MSERAQFRNMRATVSGSFRRHMSAIYDAVIELAERGLDVLSPADPRIVDQIGDFVFVASDKVRSIKMVQDRHLECIRASDFLWLVAPDGYVGQSASMEIGYAVAHEIPVFCQSEIVDGTLGKYVQIVPNLYAAIHLRAATARQVADLSLLIHPLNVIDQAESRLDDLRQRMAVGGVKGRDAEDEAILTERSRIAALISPTAAPRRHRTAN